MQEYEVRVLVDKIVRESVETYQEVKDIDVVVEKMM